MRHVAERKAVIPNAKPGRKPILGKKKKSGSTAAGKPAAAAVVPEAAANAEVLQTILNSPGVPEVLNDIEYEFLHGGL